MKIEVLKRFVYRSVRVVHPGEVLDVAPEEGDYLIQRGMAKEVKPPEPKEEEKEEA